MDASIKVAEIPASRGASWIGEAWRLFAAAPLPWMGLCAGWISITFALLIVPIIGGVVANFLQPVFFASFAIAAYKQMAGEPIVMADLFSGFKRNLRALVNLGVLILAAVLAIIVAMAWIGLPIAMPAGEAPTLDDFAEVLQGKEWIVALTLLLLVGLKGAVWFAPPLIAFHGMGTLEAIRWSVYAAISNLGALAVYGVFLFAIFFVASIPWGLGLIVAMPIMAISSYTGYREVFESVKPQ